ncbi:hypothetical protein COV56_03160, partial [Candidatus Kuenenbacteria bacterium CG11_big_fil_rev_8_21_14_0_20_37_9]
GVSRKPAPVAEKEPVKIGVILPLTGEAATYGISDREGMLLAIEKINAEGGINGRKVRLIVEDSEGDPKGGISAFRKLVEIEGVKVIMTELSSVSMAIAPLVKEKQIVMFSIAGHPELTRQSEFIFRNYPTNTSIGGVTAELVMERLNLKKAGIMYINDEWGASLANAFREKFKGSIKMESFGSNDKDFRTQITKLKAFEPEAILVLGHSNVNLGIALRQIKELGYNGIILSTLEVSYPEVLETAGEAINGVIYSDLNIDYENNPVAKEMKEIYVAKYDKEPDLSVAFAYDMTNLLINAIKKGGYEVGGIKDELLKTKDFEGVFGKLNINEIGDVEFTLVLKIFRNGKSELYR